MNEAGCTQFRTSFSDYLDGAVSGHQMQSIARHLESCAGCAAEFAGMRAIQEALTALRPAKAPEDLGLRLRLAISREQAARRSNWVDSLQLRWENALRPLLFQLSTGLAGAVLLIGTVMLLSSVVAPPAQVLASDGPTVITTPHYLYSASLPRPIVTPHDTTIIVEALVNDQGLVYDYKIVSGPQDEAVQRQLIDQLMLSVFEPARVFRVAVRGRVVLTFAGISVRG